MCPGTETAKLARYRYELQLRRAEEELARNGAGMHGAAPADSAARPAIAADTDRQEADGYDTDVAVVRAATEAQRRRRVPARG